MKPARSKKALIMLALAVLAVAVGIFVLSPRHHIDVEHSLLIKEGMTEAEVEAIFGVPAGNYDRYGLPPMRVALSDPSRPRPIPTALKTWTSRRGSMSILFAVTTEDHRVVDWDWDGSSPRNVISQTMEKWFGPFNQFHPMHSALLSAD